MVTAAVNRTEIDMAERLRSLEPGSQRFEILATAIDFKRSWVSLAKRLVEVERERGYREWGFRTFEAYAKHELHLKRETALKLVRSYGFMREHEPALLQAVETDERPSDAPAVPDFQSVDVLAEARSNPYLSEGDYRELRDQVFRDEVSPNQLKKLLRERAPEPQEEKKEPKEPQAGMRKALSLAERLYGLLLEEEAPSQILQTVEEAVGQLRRVLEE